MKIRTKLQLALGTLFLLIALLSAFAIRQVNLLAQDTKNILVANYKSLNYSRSMLKAINNDTINPADLKHFEAFLEAQLANITEVGERELTQDLKQNFANLKKNPEGRNEQQLVRTSLHSIMKLNMDAIQRKSSIAGKTADDSVLWISFTAGLCICMGFSLLVNLPGAIAAPVQKLTESISQIAQKNYSQRVYIKGHDEFATMANTFNSMAQKLEEYTASDLEKLMTEKKRVETLIGNMGDPVIVLDENHSILLANDEALNITALKRENITGKNISEIALTNDLVRNLSKEAVLGNYKQREVLKIFSGGREGYFEKNIIPIQIIPTGESQLRHIGSVIILRNITAHKELDEAKTSFIATVSHEFKTPIASMKMSLQLLENEKTGILNSEQQHLINSIKDDTARLLRTTGELLNITQVETGKTSLSVESADVAAMVADAVEANKIQAAAKEINIQVDIEEGFPDVLADSEKTTWILSNLISNAIRYSYENAQVVISAEKHQGTATITVKDNGVGIADNYIGKVFDKYFRVPGSQKEGTGLGLAISKEFMEAQGGTITVASIPGEGSSFTLTFKRTF